MGKTFTTRAIAKMHRVYRQTMSCAMTAKACGCCVNTVVKYRDLQKWITPEQKKLCDKNKRDTTLTPDIATKLAGGWRLHIEDTDLCPIVGITHGQLRWWLQNNTEVTIIRTVRRMGSDGKPIEDEEGVRRIIETIGLHDLRAKEWASFEHDYMAKHAMVVENAIAENDHKNALKGIEWALMKRLPKKFAEAGGVNVNVNTALQANVVSMTEINLPLEVRKQILAQIREKKDKKENEDG